MAKENNAELTKISDTLKAIGKSNYNDYNNHRLIDDGGKPRRQDMRGILNYCWGEDYNWPEYDLNDMNKQCQERYPMITLMDDAHYNWRGTKEASEAAAQYITLVEATYNAKKKIKNAKDKVERMLDNQPQNI